ncbi:hypothetical protein AGMMS50268_19680 [Spirochaetia bacterium]|nr:hypothetical protein AGMMS50268_19680 [Spirochaetia bacterium]
MASNDEEYYETLIDFFWDPESVEIYLKASVKAYAVNKYQVQSFIGCAEEVIEYIKPDPLSRDFGLFEEIKIRVRKSLGLLYEYLEKVPE